MKVLRAIPKENTLSFEEITKLDKIFEIISEKNLLKNNSLSNNRWEMLFEFDKEINEKGNNISSEDDSWDDENSSDEEFNPTFVDKRKKAKI